MEVQKVTLSSGYRILMLTSLLYFTAMGHKLNVEISGQLRIYHNITADEDQAAMQQKALETKVVSKISRNINIEEECVTLDELLYRASDGNMSEQIVNYTVTISQDRCDLTQELLTITLAADLGITQVSVNPDRNLESEFWQDKMNSILVFGGCGALLVIMFVTCVIMTTGCYRRDNKSKRRVQTYNPSKQHHYQPYAVDTMTLDHRKYSRKENFHSVREKRQEEPTTIERWVNSQLSKGRRKSSALDLNQDGQRFSNIKTSDSHQDMSTTDSGIVITTSLRRHNSELSYILEAQQPKEDATQRSEGVYRKRRGEEPYYHESQYETCNSIDYIQRDNEAYINSSSNSNDMSSLEESSKL